MQTNLCKVGGKWTVELIGGPDEETLIKTFSGKEHATNRIRMWNSGQAEIPVLKKKKSAKAKPEAKPKVKATKK